MKTIIAQIVSRIRRPRADTIPAAGAVPPLHRSTPARADIARPAPRATLVRPSVALLITGCTDPLMWYSGKVGKHVPYCGTWPEGYKSREDAGYLNIVRFEDAVLVHVK